MAGGTGLRVDGAAGAADAIGAVGAATLRSCVEHRLSPALRRQITALRNRCFPLHAVDRPYYKQLPHWRLLARQGGRLLGQVAVDHRVVAWDGQPTRIFGVVDLCVDPVFRGHGLAGRMLGDLHRRACASGIAALLLAADDPRLYLRHGFVALDAGCTWLRLHEHRTLGVASQALRGTLMCRQAAARVRPARTIDLLGTLF